MRLNEYLKTKRGLASNLANILGVYPPDISMWSKGAVPVPHKYGAEIEKHTNGRVTRKDLFPNDWQKIWPELVEKEVA